MNEIENLKFPIGRYQKPELISDEVVKNAMDVIERFPTDLMLLLEEFTPEQLTQTYRPDGWSALQVVHHCADSHMNSLIRFKLALTEDNPIIKPYEESLWGDLIDSMDMDLTSSILIIQGVHDKWSKLLQQMSPDDWMRTYTHPEHDAIFTLKEAITQYDWHCKHHLAHVKLVLNN